MAYSLFLENLTENIHRQNIQYETETRLVFF